MYRRRLLDRARIRLEAKLESLTLGWLMLHATGYHAEGDRLMPKMDRIAHSLTLIEARRKRR